MKTGSNGFSILEVMITLLIVGILASTAYISYEKFVIKAKQNEAKINLKSIYNAQKFYFLENGKYASNFNQLGLNDISGDARYVYQINLLAIDQDFKAEASANLDNDPKLDVWEINSDGQLRTVSNDLD